MGRGYLECPALHSCFSLNYVTHWTVLFISRHSRAPLMQMGFVMDRNEWVALTDTVCRVFVILNACRVQGEVPRANEGQMCMYAAETCHVFITLTDDPLSPELFGNTKQITCIIRLPDTFSFRYWSCIKHLCHRDADVIPAWFGFKGTPYKTTTKR